LSIDQIDGGTYCRLHYADESAVNWQNVIIIIIIDYYASKAAKYIMKSPIKYKNTGTQKAKHRIKI